MALNEWCVSRDMGLNWTEVIPAGHIKGVERIGQYRPFEDVRAQLAEHHTLTELSERSGGPARDDATLVAAIRAAITRKP